MTTAHTKPTRDYSKHLAYIYQLAVEQKEFIYTPDSAPFCNSACQGLFYFDEAAQRVCYEDGWPSTSVVRPGAAFHVTPSVQNNNNTSHSDEDRRMQLLFDHFGKTLSEDDNEVDVVAVYVTTTGKGITVDYMDRERLYSFLCSSVKPDGILQRYIVPLSFSHVLMQVVWTKDLCLIEGRQNVNSIFDHALSVLERTTTTASQPAKSAEIQVPKPMRARMTELCKRYAKMLTNINLDAHRMCLYFTMSSTNRLVMLWCSMLETFPIEEKRAKTAPEGDNKGDHRRGGHHGATSGAKTRPTSRGDGGGFSDPIQSRPSMLPELIDTSNANPQQRPKASVKAKGSQPGTPLNSPNHRPGPIFPMEDHIWFDHGVWIDNLAPSSCITQPSPEGIHTRHIVFLNFDPLEDVAPRDSTYRFGYDEECEEIVTKLQTSFESYSKSVQHRQFKDKHKHLQTQQLLWKTSDEIIASDPTMREHLSRPVSRSSISNVHGTKLNPTRAGTAPLGKKLPPPTPQQKPPSSSTKKKLVELLDTTALEVVQPTQSRKTYDATGTIADIRARHVRAIPTHVQDSLIEDYEQERRMDEIRRNFVQSQAEESDRRRRSANRKPGQVSISENLKRMEQEQGWNTSVVMESRLDVQKPSPLQMIAERRRRQKAMDSSRPYDIMQSTLWEAMQHSTQQCDTSTLVAPDGSLMNYMFRRVDRSPARFEGSARTMNHSQQFSSRSSMSGGGGRGNSPMTPVQQPSRRFTVPPPPIMDVHNPHQSISQSLLLEASKHTRRPNLYDVITQEPKKEDDAQSLGGKSDASLIDPMKSPRRVLGMIRKDMNALQLARSTRGASFRGNASFGGSYVRGEYTAVESKLNTRRMVDAAEDMIYRAYSLSLEGNVPEKYEFPYPTHIEASQAEVRAMMLALGIEEKVKGDDVYFLVPSNHVKLSNALSTMQAFARYVDTLYGGNHTEHIATVRRLVENGMSFFDAVNDVRKAYPL